jgi:hypothetical protein
LPERFTLVETKDDYPCTYTCKILYNDKPYREYLCRTYGEYGSNKQFIKHIQYYNKLGQLHGIIEQHNGYIDSGSHEIQQARYENGFCLSGWNFSDEQKFRNRKYILNISSNTNIISHYEFKTKVGCISFLNSQGLYQILE